MVKNVVKQFDKNTEVHSLGLGSGVEYAFWFIVCFCFVIIILMLFESKHLVTGIAQHGRGTSAFVDDEKEIAATVISQLKSKINNAKVLIITIYNLIIETIKPLWRDVQLRVKGDTEINLLPSFLSAPTFLVGRTYIAHALLPGNWFILSFLSLLFSFFIRNRISSRKRIWTKLGGFKTKDQHNQLLVRWK